MRQTDLELYRWKWHNEVYLQFKRVQAAKNQVSLLSYWKEYGAFVSVLPRQTGKTTMLKIMIDEISRSTRGERGLGSTQYIVVCPHSVYADNFILKTGVLPDNVTGVPHFGKWKQRQGANYSDIHLFVDEFCFISKGSLDVILDYEWKSVTMVSTLR